jgi:hypothetical protein
LCCIVAANEILKRLTMCRKVDFIIVGDFFILLINFLFKFCEFFIY